MYEEQTNVFFNNNIKTLPLIFFSECPLLKNLSCVTFGLDSSWQCHTPFMNYDSHKCSFSIFYMNVWHWILDMSVDGTLRPPPMPRLFQFWDVQKSLSPSFSEWGLLWGPYKTFPKNSQNWRFGQKSGNLAHWNTFLIFEMFIYMLNDFNLKS